MGLFTSYRIRKKREALRNTGPFLFADEQKRKIRIVKSLGRINDPEAVEIVANILIHDKDLQLRELAAITLGSMESPKAITPLLVTLCDGIPFLRKCAAESLNNLGEAQWQKMIRDWDEDSEYDLIRLAKSNDSRIQKSFKKALLTSKHYRTDYLIFEGIKNSKHPDWIPWLLSIVDDKNMPEESRQKAVAALGTFKDKSIAGYLINIMHTSKHEHIRRMAATMLKPSDFEKNKYELFQVMKEMLLSDKEASVRRAAVEKLPLINESMELLLTTLENDNDEAVRGSAALRLGLYKEQKVADALLKALDSEVMGDGVRENAIRSLGKMDKTFPIEPFVKALEDDNRAIRRAAAETLIAYAKKNFPALNKRWKLLAARIEVPHKDHLDKPTGQIYINDCHDDGVNWHHSDSGIGLEIPPELKKI